MRALLLRLRALQPRCIALWEESSNTWRGDMAPTDAKGGYGPFERKPRKFFPRQGRTLKAGAPWGRECRIRRHGDRQTTGDWQFEVILRWGAKSPQIANRPCSVCRGAPTDAKGRYGPHGRKPRNFPPWTSIWGLGLAIWGLDNDSGTLD